MSERKRSRTDAISRAPVATMADLLASIQADASLSPRQREGRASAVRTYAKWLGRPLSALSAELRTVRQELAALSAVRLGVSAGRLANVRSFLMRSLHAIRADLVDTRRQPLLPAWADLFAAAGDVRARYGCSRFGRWCSARGLGPHKVTQELAMAFAADLVDRVPSRRPRSAFVAFCRAWNAAAVRWPQVWPQVRLDAGDQRRAYVLSVDRIHPWFRTDVETMLRRFGAAIDLPRGFTRPYAPSTLAELRRIVLRLYSVAVACHRPEPVIASLSDLVQPEIVRAILGHYLEKFTAANTRSAAKYAHFIFVIAKYWVRLPPDPLEKLQKFRTTLTPKRSGMADKNRATLRCFDDAATAERLLTLGDAAVATFRRAINPKVRHALALQVALAIEILIAAPVRSQNLASIDLSRHLIWRVEGRKAVAHLVFPAVEVKNDADLEFRLPGHLIAMLTLYLEAARPLLAGASDTYLFPGCGNRPKGPSLLSKQIAMVTQRALGTRVTAHQFRHLVGYLFLKDNPTGHEVVRQLLGHKNITTTITFYAGMEQAAAVQAVDAFIERQRQKIRARLTTARKFTKPRGA